MLGKIAKVAAGLIITVLVLVFTTVRIAFEIIGVSTAPDDFALLKQRMPRVLDWLFTTPWPVPTSIIIAVAVLGAWLLVEGVRGAARETASGEPTLSSADVEALIESALARRSGDAGPTIDEGGAIAERLARIEATMPDIQIARAAARALIAKERAAQVAELQDFIGPYASVDPPPRPATMPEDVRNRQAASLTMGRRPGQAVESMLERIERLPLETQQFIEARAAVIARVKGDAIYAKFDQDDNQYGWTSLEEKRAWFIQKFTAQRFLSILRQIHQQLEREAEEIRKIKA